MNVYKKLQIARMALQEKDLKKSGKNKFAGYEYFELPDFLPTVQTIFGDTGLCPVFRCDSDGATLTIYDSDKPDEWIVFSAPMSTAELRGCHAVQNLGAVISYLRRYLYINAMEIVEHDALDATTGNPATKAEPPKVTPKKTAEGATVTGKAAVKTTQDWEIKITAEDSASEQEWLDMVWAAATTMLGFATKESDVMAIFKANKVLFDDAKSRDADWFKKLMEEFGKVKNKLKEQE